MNPAETIVVLLEWYPAVRDGLRNGEGGDGSGWRHMHEWWHQGSFADLERYLASMRQVRLDNDFEGYSVFELRSHLDWWYLEARRKSVPHTRPVRKHGKIVGHVPTGLFKVEIRRDDRADSRRAEAGVRYLESCFERDGKRPRLPVDLLRIATGAPERAA